MRHKGIVYVIFDLNNGFAGTLRVEWINQAVGGAM
jgi:hypothetical protein